ncbi:MAG: hypothetical protein D3914_02410 [Candidatus Electrothrix sp. LOE2]|nr:hypothetical protein [Candidatus Electrothrix sp. LOE2]
MFNLCREWHHVMIKRDAGEKSCKVRHGKNVIKFVNGSLFIGTGKNINSCNKEISSLWKSKYVYCENSHLVIHYSKNGVLKSNTPIEGVIELSITEKNPEVLEGTFRDIAPANDQGLMYFYKRSRDADLKLKELLDDKTDNKII